MLDAKVVAVIGPMTSGMTKAIQPEHEATQVVLISPTATAFSLRIWKDDGVGIPPELLPRIFAPFVTSKMGRGGTGLGLYIAHNIAANMLGGSISVISAIGHGTTFELNIPLVAPKPAPDGKTVAEWPTDCGT